MVKKGKISYYNSEKSFGFIIITKSKQKVFFHTSSFKGDKSYIEEGLEVEVDVDMTNPKGPSAKYVKTNQKVIKYYLPKDTLELIGNGNEIDNNYLRINTLVNKRLKWDKLNIVDDKNIININKKRKNLLNLLKNEGYNVVYKTLKLDGKMCIGLGQASVYETSLNLDFINGIPYIPASSIKGLTKRWINNENYDINVDNIGKEKEQGTIIFLDAYPQQHVSISLDIMNPHFGGYYSSKGELSPTEDKNPVPVNFPVIENTSFEFTLISKKLNEEQLIKWMRIVEDALFYNGIGAKTSIGYGSFKPYNMVSNNNFQTLLDKFNKK